MLKASFEPCIPSGEKKVPDRADWLHEIKHDGYRLIIQPDGKCVRLWTGQRPRLERLLPADHRGYAGLPQQLVRPRWRGRAMGDRISMACIRAGTTTRYSPTP